MKGGHIWEKSRFFILDLHAELAMQAWKPCILLTNISSTFAYV